jgi:NAD(P) transhydrogenase subunit alpha
MDPQDFMEKAKRLASEAQDLADQALTLAGDAGGIAVQAADHAGAAPLVVGLTVLVLAVFVGYHVVWSVTGGFLVTHRMLSMFKKKKR